MIPPLSHNPQQRQRVLAMTTLPTMPLAVHGSRSPPPAAFKDGAYGGFLPTVPLQLCQTQSWRPQVPISEMASLRLHPYLRLNELMGTSPLLARFGHGGHEPLASGCCRFGVPAALGLLSGLGSRPPAGQGCQPLWSHRYAGERLWWAPLQVDLEGRKGGWLSAFFRAGLLCL